jgi:hypothetical protein
VNSDSDVKKLQSLGVKSKSDLKFLTDTDLTEAGFSIVDARKLVATEKTPAPTV